MIIGSLVRCKQTGRLGVVIGFIENFPYVYWGPDSPNELYDYKKLEVMK
jgi:hypothetical protein